MSYPRISQTRLVENGGKIGKNRVEDFNRPIDRTFSEHTGSTRDSWLGPAGGTVLFLLKSLLGIILFIFLRRFRPNNIFQHICLFKVSFSKNMFWV